MDDRFKTLLRSSLLGVLLATAWAGPGCQKPSRELHPIPDDLDREIAGHEIAQIYGTPAFVYREGRPGEDPKIYLYTDEDLPEIIDDTNLVIYAEGSGDQARHFCRTAELIAQSRYHPKNDAPNLLFVLVHWSESTSVVAEHLNYDGQEHGSKVMRRMCDIHKQRHGDGGFVGIIGFSAGTRVTQLAFGANLPEGRPGDALPTLDDVPPEMATVDNVVYLGSSLNRDDPLPYVGIQNRFINFVNPRDSHYGDRAPYYAPAGTSPVYLRVVQANMYLARPRTGASANGFSRLPTLTDETQFDILKIDRRLDKIFRMVNVYAPVQLIPWSVVSVPILDDDLDTWWNLAPNHYSLVGRGPEGKLFSKTFDQYTDLSYEFVREQVASATLHGVVYEFDLFSEPKPNTLPALLDPANLILGVKSRGQAPRPTPPPAKDSRPQEEAPPDTPREPEPPRP